MRTQNSAAIEQAERGLAYLLSIQTPQGSVAGDSLVANAVVLQCLAGAATPDAQALRHGLTGWLLQCKQPDGSFGCGLHTTCCIMRALVYADSAAITSDMLGALARQLVTAEYQLGGPYRGLADELQPDIGLQVVIADLAARLGAPLPQVEAYIAESFRDRQTNSAFYRGTPSLPGFGRPANIEHLLAAQLPDGSWPATPYCREDDGSWHQSTAVSTALAVQLLLPDTTPASSRKRPQTVAQDTAYGSIMRIIEHELASLPEPLHQTARRTLERIVRADDDHGIALLAFRFAAGLRTPATVPRERLQRLGVGNIYNWMAYTVYDDFLDGCGDPILLSIANVSLRSAVSHFRAGAPQAHGFEAFIAQVFTAIDAANAWEVAHCHMPHTKQTVTLRALPAYGDYSKLAERSYSHVLPALGVLASCGITPDAPAAVAIGAAFKHYLIARQLIDDMRDWEDDVRAGHISPIVGAIIGALPLGHGPQNFAALLPQMKRQFWDVTLGAQSQEVIGQINLARRAIVRSELLLADNVLTELLDGLDQVIARTSSEQGKVREFLQGYTA